MGRGGLSPFPVLAAPAAPAARAEAPPAAPQAAMEPTAAQVFCGRVLGMVNAEDVNAIILAQKNM